MATKFLNCDDENNQEEECEEEDTINYEKDNIGAFFKNLLIVICVLWSFSFLVCIVESYSEYYDTTQEQNNNSNITSENSFKELLDKAGKKNKK